MKKLRQEKVMADSKGGVNGGCFHLIGLDKTKMGFVFQNCSAPSSEAPIGQRDQRVLPHREN